MDLTTAVTPVVLTVLVATVITLPGPVSVDVNQDTTLTRASYAILVSKTWFGEFAQETSQFNICGQFKPVLLTSAYQLHMLQNVLRAALGLTTAVTPAVLTVLMETVITLTDPVSVGVNQDMTLTRASFAIKVSKNIIIICSTNNTTKIILK